MTIAGQPRPLRTLRFLTLLPLRLPGWRGHRVALGLPDAHLRVGAPCAVLPPTRHLHLRRHVSSHPRHRTHGTNLSDVTCLTTFRHRTHHDSRLEKEKAAT